MKWQVIPRYPEEEITVRHYRWLKLFGARMHVRAELNCCEFRLAYFSIIHSPRPLQQGKRISIPIPFMKNDHGIIWFDNNDAYKN